MKPSPASTPPAWLADIFPGLSDSVDTTDYDYEELVARRLVSGWPSSWVRDAVSRLEGGGAWEDRLLTFVGKYAAQLARYGWKRRDLFPESELMGVSYRPLCGLGWQMLDALACGGAITEVTTARIVYASGRGVRGVIEKPL
jgi:hypothetical protein